MRTVILTTSLLATAAVAFPRGMNDKRGYSCETFLVDIPVEAVETVVLPLPEIQDRYEAISYGQLLASQAGSRTSETAPPPPPKTSSLTKTFQISGDYCTPNQLGPKASTIQLLTHGIGFNRTYWDFYLPESHKPQYSHIHAATAAGYSTISWNRYPITAADPYTEIQASVEVAILTQLTTLARAGKIPGQTSPPKHIIHVGHSYGSQLTIGLAALAPDITDGIVLTGLGGGNNSLIGNTAFATLTFHLANENSPDRFPKDVYSNGWLTWQSSTDQQFFFYHYPDFDPAVLNHAEAIKFPFTLAEFFGAGIVPNQAPEFSKPVLYLVSEHDPLCGFDCNDAFGEGSSAWKEAFSGTDDIEAFVQPGAGHALPLHRNVTAAYERLDEWIEKRFV